MNSQPGESQYASEYAGQPLVNVCIAFATLEAFFIIAFVFSWHFNRDGNSHNTKGVYALILLAYLFSFAGVVIGIIKITIGGAGYHANILPPRTVRTFLQLMTAHEAVYVWSITFPKLTILSLYLRLFTAKLSRRVLYLTGAVIIATCLFGFISVFTNCRPLDSFWDLHFDKCIMDPMTAFRLYSIPVIATDIVIVVLPITVLWGLKVGAWEKFGVALTFSAMAVGIITAILRLVAFAKTNIFQDITYLCISTSCWTIIEPGIYLLAATVPTLRPVIRQATTKILPLPLVSRWLTRGFGLSGRSSILERVVVDQPGTVEKASMKKSKTTIGERANRALHLDDYHRVRYGRGLASVSTDDEESKVFADAIVHETLESQGRNLDGTLREWSPQPVRVNPLRTSDIGS